MSSSGLIPIEAIILIGLFLIATYLFIPKAVEHWRLWEKTGKSTYLSSSIAAGICAALVLIGDLVRFIKIMAGA